MSLDLIQLLKIDALHIRKHRELHSTVTHTVTSKSKCTRISHPTIARFWNVKRPHDPYRQTYRELKIRPVVVTVWQIFVMAVLCQKPETRSAEFSISSFGGVQLLHPAARGKEEVVHFPRSSQLLNFPFPLFLHNPSPFPLLAVTARHSAPGPPNSHSSPRRVDGMVTPDVPFLCGLITRVHHNRDTDRAVHATPSLMSWTRSASRHERVNT